MILLVFSGFMKNLKHTELKKGKKKKRMKSFITPQCPVSKAQKFICVFQTHENLNWKEHDVKKTSFI